MMLLAPLDQIVESLAANHGFQAFVGGTLGDTSRIYRDVLPPPSTDEYTPDEMFELRPFVQLWVSESQGWKAVRDAAQNCYRPSGLIILRIEWSFQDDTDEQTASRTFLEHMSNILSNDDNTGLMQDSQRINTHSIALAGWARADKKSATQYGDAFVAEFELTWGANR